MCAEREALEQRMQALQRGKANSSCRDEKGGKKKGVEEGGTECKLL